MPKHTLRERDHGSPDDPGGVWVCASCGEVHEAEYDTCWKCGTGADGRAAPDQFADRIVDFDPTPAAAAHMAQAFPRSIGMTHDGQPIYPVVGYTADGQRVTADRAVGVHLSTAGTNSMAIVALVTGLTVAPLGIVFGHIALSQIKQSGQGGRGLAIAGLVLGYVSIALFAIAFLVIGARL